MSARKLSSISLPSLFFFLLMIVPAAPRMVFADSKITVKLEELDTQKPINAPVSVETEEDSKELAQKKSGLYELKESLKIKESEACSFNIEPGEVYSTRAVKIKSNAFTGKAAKTFTFSLAKGKEYTYSYLNEGLKYFGMNKHDGALAYYEIAYKNKGQGLAPENENINEFAIQLAYNYAKALHNTCIILSYDTCDLSESLFSQLLVLYDSGKYQKIFKHSRITRDSLTAPLNDFVAVGPNIKYGRISKLYSEGKYNEAAILAAEALDESKIKPEVFSKIGLTKDRLHMDAGVSYLKAAEKAKTEDAASEDVQVLLENAQENLKEVKVPDKATKSNLNIINTRLKQLD